MEITLPRRSPFNVPEVGSRRLNDHFYECKRFLQARFDRCTCLTWIISIVLWFILTQVLLIRGHDHMTLPFRQLILSSGPDAR